MKSFYVACIFGLTGAVAVSIAIYMGWPAWVLFIAWTSYYLFGKAIRTAWRPFLQIALGIIMGACIQVTSVWLTKSVGHWATPVSIFLFIGALAYIVKIHTLDNLPAWFIGLIIFFGTHPAEGVLPLAALLIPVVFGFLFAWVNDMLVGFVQKSHNRPI